MKLVSLVSLSLLLSAPAFAAGDEVCRSVSTSWQSGAQSLQTRISMQAVNGCKRIFHVVDGIETEGRDCNCDLVADGMEARFPAPPSALQGRRLIETCLGPSTDPGSETLRMDALSSPAEPEQPRIIFR